MKELIGQEKQWEKWKLKRQRGKNEVIGMIKSLGERREKLKRPWHYEKGNDEDRRSKHYNCEKECVNRLDELRKDGRE